MPPKAQKLYDFEVSGRYSFPFDMLRYDRCWPRTESDSAKLEATTRRSISVPGVIKMRGLTDPTVGRWESFGWKVSL
jgi:hypothetical protein